MLQLINIHKSYSPGENEVRALRGIDLQFRKSEFVSILGPSGCGKTTMLNIIGGLDKYSEGDLVINGVSTREYGDREWDTYRNHSVGFVFQSYNLIPHQTVLSNVEIALSLSGVGKKERKERAIKALEQVGLGDQLKKKPSEMSGGQMQRVAIARALVNNPDIILADEPTGALDTETSVQVMEILKEISRERLVIMVTHNPELAETYSTRIIRMLDGKITDDSMPLDEAERKALHADYTEKPEKKQKMPSMSLRTSFGLSLKNLITKKGRTILTAFAGSIGIIGIALIYAVSQGTHGYIEKVQEDTLASYPLTLQATTVDMGTLMKTFMGAAEEGKQEHPLDGVYSQSVLFEMINAFNNMETTENDLNAFKARVEEELKNPDSQLSQALSGVQYTYDFDLTVYTQAVDGSIILSNTEQMLMEAMRKNLKTDMSAMITMRDQMGSSMGMSMSTPGMELWTQMLPAKDGGLINPLLKEQYDIKGQWPDSYDEIVLIVDENYELDDLTLMALGLKPQSEMDAVFEAVNNGTEIPTKQQKWSFEEIMAMEFRVVPNNLCYVYDETTGAYKDLREGSEANLRFLYDNGLSLRVTGILIPKENATSHMLSGSIGYTAALTEYIVNQADASNVIQAQLQDPNTDVLTGLPFRDQGTMDPAEKIAKFKSYIAEQTIQGKADAYKLICSANLLRQKLGDRIATTDRAGMEQIVIDMMAGSMPDEVEAITKYVKDLPQEELQKYFTGAVIEDVQKEVEDEIADNYGAMSPEEMAAALDMAMPHYTDELCAAYYDVVLKFSESTYEENLRKLGYVQLDYPDSMNLYASSFENKKVIEDFIGSYNNSVEELKKISYTDYIGLMLSGVTDIINAITYVLIAFVAISLVVSSIMIGVITLISVQERTKEIGILRAIGASKRNVSTMFNAETVIIGFASGVIGVGVTYLLCIPINAIVQALTNISNLKAYLPIETALILIAISVALTLLSGIIPSRSAAKKDPVVALRTE